MDIIEQIEVFGVSVPLVGTFTSAIGSANVQRSVIVRIRSRDGAVGLGNVDPAPGFSTETVEEDLSALSANLASAVLGSEASNIHQILQRMDGVQEGFWEAKAAIEMAAIDLSARRTAQPVHAYLGGALKRTVGFNAWIGMLGPDEAATAARAWVARGFRSAKVKIGGDVATDIARVRAVRAAAGPQFKIRVDANCHYSKEAAVEAAGPLAALDVELLEQPVAADRLEDLAFVRREANEAGLAVMADEAVTDHASLIEIIRAGAADLVKLKIMKQGGLVRTARMIATAEAAGMRCVVGHGFGLSLNTTAEIMLASTSNAVLDALESVGPLAIADDVVTRKLDLAAGSIALPQGPGLGLDLDEAKLEQYRFFGQRIA